MSDVITRAVQLIALQEANNPRAQSSVLQEEKKMWHRGFLEVIDNGKYVSVAYGGNMGSRISDVAKEFDALFGTGKFQAVKAVGTIHKDKWNTYSDPSYEYVLDVPRDAFYAIIENKE